MKKIVLPCLLVILCFTIFCRQSAFSAVPRSPFPSEVAGITIPNTRQAASGGMGTVLRGSAPLKEEVRQLKDYGVTDVIIFKNQTKNEVDSELLWLRGAGYAPGRIRQIPFRWKRLGPFRQTCEQTIAALRILSEIRGTPGRTAFFHCTVGEDRTGFLAGLFRMLEENWDTEKAFKQELCRNGYEAGNSRKPAQVVADIRAELTPAYLKMASLISGGVLTRDDLDSSVCASEPAIDPETVKKFICSSSP